MKNLKIGVIYINFNIHRYTTKLVYIINFNIFHKDNMKTGVIE